MLLFASTAPWGAKSSSVEISISNIACFVVQMKKKRNFLCYIMSYRKYIKQARWYTLAQKDHPLLKTTHM